MISKSELIISPNRFISLSEGTQIDRLKRAPKKLLYLKFLDFISRRQDKPIRV
ncbi:MAG: hypothetical protein ACFFDN_24200 [Candidatus Hodarchaeota archaeon]